MGQPIRVLCVDDDEALMSLVTRRLREADGVDAVGETDPRDALDRVRTEQVDCVVSDYQMPRLNGLELLDEVRAIEPDLPFVLFTGRGSEEVASEAVSAGVTDYIRKRTGTEQYELLVNRVRNAVERNRARLDYRTVFDGVIDAIVVLDPAAGEIVEVNRAFREQWGYEAGEAVGLSPGDLMVAADVGERLCDASSDTLDVECVTADGDRFWASVSVKRATIRGRERVLAIVRDVTERREREAALAELVHAERNLLSAESRAEIGETTVELVTEAFGFDAAQLLLDDGRLSSVAAVGPAPVDDEVFATARRQLAAQALEEGDVVHHDAAQVAQYPDAHDLHAELLVPVGDRGVLVGNATGDGTVGAYERDLARVLAANVAVALDRAERKQLLRRREAELERQRDELASLNHTNEVIREINRALVEVSDREEIERVVCERLAAADGYRLAWIGAYDLTAREVTPEVWAGIEGGILRDRTVAVSDGPFATAIDDRSIAVAESVLGDDGTPAATDSRTSAVIPLAYQGKLYDVLVVAASDPSAFGDRERAVLAELGGTIGYAMHAVEQRQALVADSVTELEVEVHGEATILGSLSAAAGAVKIDGTVVGDDGSLRLFVDVAGGPVDERLDALDRVDEWTVIAERPSSTLYELTVQRGSVVDFLADNSATLRDASAADGTSTFVVRLPSGADTRTLIDLLRETYGEVTVRAQREKHREPDAAELETSLREELTDRQHEVLQAAQHAGFFEWPRVTAGEELADALGIAQSTFHEHLRAGQRKVFRELFEERETGPG